MVSNLKTSVLLFTLIFSMVFAPVAITSASTTNNPQLDQSPGVINILTRHEVAIQDSFAEGFLNSQLASDLGYSTGDKDKIVFWEVTTTQGWITGGHVGFRSLVGLSCPSISDKTKDQEQAQGPE